MRDKTPTPESNTFGDDLKEVASERITAKHLGAVVIAALITEGAGIIAEAFKRQR